MIPKIPAWMLPVILPVLAWKKFSNQFFFAQVLAQYAASFARVFSWLIVAGIVYRTGGADDLGILMLLRGTVGILSYTSLGLLPGLIHLLSKPVPIPEEQPASDKIEYESLPVESPFVPRKVFTTAFLLTAAACLVGILLTAGYASHLDSFHQFSKGVAEKVSSAAFAIGLGVMIRTLSDVFGARLQASRRIATDAFCNVLAEIAFVVGTVFFTDVEVPTNRAALAFALGSAVLLVTRALFAIDQFQIRFKDFDTRLVRPLLAGGSFVLLSQIADWLYAPVNQILIERFLDINLVATYVPAIQVDGALLLLVSGLATVLLPLTARAYHSHQWSDLYIYYVLGTIFSFIVLVIGAVFLCLIDDWLFRKWFADPLPATQAILPLVLIHTVIGGSASIGRSVLFGMGRIKPYAIAAIVGGVANAILAILVVTLTDWGLNGIIYVTILTVFVRCAIWLPWYTLRAIYQEGGPFRIRWN